MIIGGLISPGVNSTLDQYKNDLLHGASFGVTDKRDRSLPNVLLQLEEKGIFFMIYLYVVYNIVLIDSYSLSFTSSLRFFYREETMRHHLPQNC
jgi:hypothetical protein